MFVADTSITACYDEDTDLLYATIGQPRAARSYEVDDRIYVRLNPGGEVVGLVIVDCSERLQIPPEQAEDWLFRNPAVV